ncbi:hypothetical protein KVV02_005431 [Mortierella alpina]|uniref:BHLH domain-containing protein n=1 Tax=Mortierella alpina TaxID=64518 RepID=A0A9P8A1R4_MORAP|nr:hypothetical protein KVV02_005431 [Mortierella alpina]
MTAANTPSPPAQQSKNVFRLHGVNVLNRKNVDSIARLTALERRRATHILDERQRRDTMNQLLTELASLVQESKQHASSSTSSTSSSSSSSLSTLAALAARQRDGLLDDLGGGGSQNSGESCSSPSPMSSPKLQQASSSSYSLCALSAAQEGSSSLIRDPTRNQLHSPPLSPSSPLTTSPYHFLGVTGGGPFPPMGSLDLSPHHGLQQQQQQQQQQQPYLPQLASVVSPMSTMTFLSPQETEEEEYQSVSQAEYRPGALWGVDHSSSSP